LNNKAGQNHGGRESSSFQDITNEMGDIRVPVREGDVTGDAWETHPGSELLNGTVLVGGGESHSVREADSGMRVLTGGSPKARPMWVDGLGSSVLAAVFVLAVILSTGLKQCQPWISLVVMVLALGSALWSLFGLKVEKDPLGRRMCLFSAALGVLVAILAFIVRAPVR
jgi:hypothetical protein